MKKIDPCFSLIADDLFYFTYKDLCGDERPFDIAVTWNLLEFLDFIQQTYLENDIDMVKHY